MQIGKRMADPSIYNRSVISGQWGDERPIPEAWMQPATEPMPTAEEVAEFNRMIKMLRTQQLMDEMKDKTGGEFLTWFHKLTKNEQTKLAAYYND